MCKLHTQWTEWSYFYRHNFDNFNTAETAFITSSYTMRLKMVMGSGWIIQVQPVSARLFKRHTLKFSCSIFVNHNFNSVS